MRTNDAYNPFGWRLAELADPVTGPTRRRSLAEGLVVAEAEELAAGRRHVTIVHGDPRNLVDSLHLTRFYETVAAIAAEAGWTRARGTSTYLTVSVADPDVDRIVASLLMAAELANPGGWQVTESPYPADAGVDGEAAQPAR